MTPESKPLLCQHIDKTRQPQGHPFLSAGFSREFVSWLPVTKRSRHEEVRHVSVAKLQPWQLPVAIVLL